VASGPEATAYFLDGAVRWALAPTGKGEPGLALDQALVGARSARPAASLAAEGRVSYLTGDRHQTGLSTADELTLAQAWPGVDVAWSGAGGQIEAIYRRAPGADPSRVEVAWRGADALALTHGGRLSVVTPVRTFQESARRRTKRRKAGGCPSTWPSSFEAFLLIFAHEIDRHLGVDLRGVHLGTKGHVQHVDGAQLVESIGHLAQQTTDVRGPLGNREVIAAPTLYLLGPRTSR
jgi:hypothetical protein